MAITPLPLFSGTPPNRTQPTAEFNTNIANWVSYTTTFQPAFNTFAEDVQETVDDAVVEVNGSIAAAAAQAVLAAGFASAASGSSSAAGVYASQALSAKDLALGAANFKGAWSSLTGALNVPASVYHNGLTYVLLINLVDVTAFEPVAGTTWAIASGDSFRRYVDGILSKATLDLNFAENSYKAYELYGLEPKQLNAVTRTTRTTAANYLSPTAITAAPVNAPRITYNPASGASDGILVEEQTTNKLLYSEDFTNAAWQQSTDIDVNVTSNAATAPDGTLTADKFFEATTTSASHDIYQVSATSFTAGVAESLSVFIKPVERHSGTLFFASGSAFSSEAGVLFDTLAGTATPFGAVVSSGIEAYPNGWFRVWAIATPDGTATGGAYIRLRNGSGLSIYPGVVGYGFYVWGAMLNTGYLRSYVKTVASQVTVDNDEISVTLPSTSEGTVIVYAGGNDREVGKAQSMFNISDGTQNNRILIRRNGSAGGTQYAVVSGGVVQASVDTSVKVRGQNNKYAISWKENRFIAVEDGALKLNDTSGAIPINATQLGIGSAGTSAAWGESLNGAVQRFIFIPRALTAAELQAATA